MNGGKMDFFEFALEVEKKTIESYRELAEKCRSNEGVKNILSMLADDHEKHTKTLQEMKTKRAGKMEETEAFRKARQVFTNMKKEKEPFSCDLDQVKLYEDAHELVLEKIRFYADSAEKMEEEDRALVKNMAEEEKKQASVLENIIEMVRRPETWLEDAEFHHLDEY
jgi:rubrerythrin